ncbi:MAG: peptide chain release factor N(5)-glutamine methyltransferase [Pseudomonadota bacterium]
MTETAEALIRTAARSLGVAGVDDPMRDATLLMRWALGVDGAGLAARSSQSVPEAAQKEFLAATLRREAREPLSHIVGTREFWGRPFRVTRDVLDPRPETETLVAEALHRGPQKRILDLGIGSGCILFTLLAEWPTASGIGVDVSEAALLIADLNARDLGVANRAHLQLGDWYKGLQGSFDLIVSNPPYIAEDALPELTPEVREHEPLQALTDGTDGLSAYHAIADGARDMLSASGWLLVEIGTGQSHAVAGIIASAGLLVHAILPDLDQRPRVVVARP